MVDGVERFVVEDGEGAGGEGADEEGAEKAGGVGDGDGVDAGKRECAFFFFFGVVSSIKLWVGFFGLSDGFMNDRENGLEMGAGSNLGDDAAILFEDIDLGNDDVAQNGLAVFHDRGGGFIT